MKPWKWTPINTCDFPRGETKSRLWRTWKTMIVRVYNKKNHKYPRYGGRGIVVCEEWLCYMNFKAWALSNGYSDELKIERVNNDGNYCPENCIWATEYVQKYNKSTTRWLEYKGELIPLGVLVERFNLNRKLFEARLRYGWSVERAIHYPNRQKGFVPYFTVDDNTKIINHDITG